MTKSPAEVASASQGRCGWCGRRLPERSGPGRPKRFCKQSCRQQAHLARRLSQAHGLSDDAVIIDRQRLEDLQGALYCLQAAVEDVDRDLAAEHDDVAVTEALNWLLDNARPLIEMWIEPRTELSPEDPLT